MSWPVGRLLADTSAWARIGEAREAWSHAVVEDRLVTVAPVELELMHSARDRRELDALLDELSGKLAMVLPFESVWVSGRPG